MDANLEHGGGVPEGGPVRFETTGVVWDPAFAAGRTGNPPGGASGEAGNTGTRFLIDFARWTELNSQREFEYRRAVAERSARRTRIGLVLLVALVFLPVIILLVVCYPDMAP